MLIRNSAIWARLAVVAICAVAWSHVAGAQQKIINGVLKATDPPDPFLKRVSGGKYVWPHKAHMLKLSAGQGVVIEMRAGRPGLHPVLRIEDGNGNSLAFDTNSQMDRYARLPFVPKKSAAFRIIATRYRGSGPYTIKVRPLVFGIAGNLTKKSKPFKVTLQAKTGYIIDLRADEDKGRLVLDAFLRLSDANGKGIMDDDDGGYKLNSRMGFFPPKTASYRIEACSYQGNGSGGFTLGVYTASPAEVISMLQDQAYQWETTRNFDAAAKPLLQIVALHTALKGKDHCQIADARRAVADLALRRRLSPAHGKELRDTALLDGLFHQMYKAGRFREALAVARRAFDIRRKHLGAKHPDYAKGLMNLSGAQLKLGNFAKALALSARLIPSNRCTRRSSCR